MVSTPFLGQAYVSKVSNLADQQLINLFASLVETKTGKSVGAFYGCPGLDLKVTVGSGPIRGAHVKKTKLYVVSGNLVYSITTGFVATKLGPLTTFSGPVSIIDNGTQLNIFDGQNGYLIDGSDNLSTLSLPFTLPVTAAFQDGFGIVNQSNSNSWFQSNLNDLSTYGALNFATAAAKPDQINALSNIHREVWLLKTTNTEIWVNVGASGFTFQRLDGIFIEYGCVAAFSVAKAGESLIWLAQNDQGQGFVVKSYGYQVRKISTFAIDEAIAGYSVISDAIGYAYEQEGHTFYVLTFPTAGVTWSADVTDAQPIMWHQRAALSNGMLNRHWGNAYAFFNGLNIIGDYQNGNLYAFNTATLLDNGTQRKWLRSWRALAKPSEQPVRFSSLRIDMQTGIGVPSGTAPNLSLRWSDDGGHNWANPRIAAAGPIGKTAQRAMFRRLGSTRRNSGLDRIFELSSTDQFGVGLIGAELE